MLVFSLSVAWGCPEPRHVAPCVCEEGSRGPEVQCSGVRVGQLREVLDALGAHMRRIWSLRVSGTDMSGGWITGALGDLDVAKVVLVDANISDIQLAEDAAMHSLDLSSNSLSRIPRTFPVGLRSLSLARNDLERLEAHSFSSLRSLLRLSLDGNRIRLVDSRAFLGTELSLTRLDLGDNGIGEIPRYALQGLRCLQGLRLHGNGLKDAPADRLPPSLRELDLSDNALDGRNLHFASLSLLNALDLSRNSIEDLEPGAFRGTQVEWLKLGNNRLTFVPRAALKNLTRLRALDLRSNRIAVLREGDFDGFSNALRYVFLQNNSISVVEPGSLSALVSAQWLYLHSNDLREMLSEAFEPLLSTLRVLDIHDNPWRCDCKVLWLRDWSVSEEGRAVLSLPKETRCDNPSRHPLAHLNASTCGAQSRHLSMGLTVMLNRHLRSSPIVNVVLSVVLHRAVCTELNLSYEE
ncbi:hypothetical protein JTE90_018136 [Oedothorax gibbosus]|uniref:LRRCT domain-containing protein n=1 Tax=Oedothorax gibbosus TaxID=931172 RepID=A0AAV6UZ26_9ARAC|nr:hypothetical protein JTE90_018136 [Oedothorax gibbosus]